MKLKFVFISILLFVFCFNLHAQEDYTKNSAGLVSSFTFDDKPYVGFKLRPLFSAYYNRKINSTLSTGILLGFATHQNYRPFLSQKTRIEQNQYYFELFSRIRMLSLNKLSINARPSASLVLWGDLVDNRNKSIGSSFDVSLIYNVKGRFNVFLEKELLSFKYHTTKVEELQYYEDNGEVAYTSFIVHREKNSFSVNSLFSDIRLGLEIEF